MDLSEVFTAEVRGLQAIYPTAHASLLNWARWSRDRAGIFPPDIAPPSLWDQADPTKFGDFADETDLENVTIVSQKETKAERAEVEPYDEKSAVEIDELIHQRFPWNVRKCLVVAYVAIVPEFQFCDRAKCSHDDFLERLERVLGAL